MAVRQPRYSKEEFARRGDEIYESQVRQQVEEGNHGKIVAIDIESGAFELAEDLVTVRNSFPHESPMPRLGLFWLGIQPSITLALGA